MQLFKGKQNCLWSALGSSLTGVFLSSEVIHAIRIEFQLATAFNTSILIGYKY